MKLTHNSLRLMVLLSSFVIAGNANAISLGSSDTCKVDYLSFQSGMIIDRYNSLGVRIFFECQRDIKKNGNGEFHTRTPGTLVLPQPINLTSWKQTSTFSA